MVCRLGCPVDVARASPPTRHSATATRAQSVPTRANSDTLSVYGVQWIATVLLARFVDDVIHVRGKCSRTHDSILVHMASSPSLESAMSSAPWMMRMVASRVDIW